MKLKLTLLILAALIGVGCTKQPSTSACVAGPDEKCPDESFLKDYQKIQDFQTKYKAPQDETDLINGIGQRLQSQVPQGYTWDNSKKKFVKMAPPIVPPTK